MKRDTMQPHSQAQQSPPEPLMIDAKAARAMLGIGARRLWSLTNCQAIPSQKIGRSVRYVPGELRAWIEGGCPTEPGSADDIREAVSE